ncbi:hypothetical protein PHYPSEUDO_015389 [Phytophthora pseudosyringae]|uniref:PUB domain-containing protein n=1 Tax=Phytophthora pseudosyringae TaxID=221518 RepID=A0A8T1W3X5_9STRA|nr:hypothetical protein PHYPSEUDO_015389 [Phytophthora pseudosyringae]
MGFVSSSHPAVDPWTESYLAKRNLSLMSEFRQATAHVEALEARIARLQQSDAENAVDATLTEGFRFLLVRSGPLNALYSLQTRQQTVATAAIDGDGDVMMEKFRARCSMVDPVTNQPRFGPKMLAKVHDLLRRYDDVKLAVQEDAPLRLQVEATIQQLAQEDAARREEEEAREREQKDAQRNAELANEVEQQRLQQEAQEREAEWQRGEQQRVEALAAAAQKKREQREKERAEEERQRKLEEEERARLNAAIPHGKAGLEKAIAMLQESTGSEALFRQSLQKLLAVVSNICSSPENAAFRHIPKDNVHFHADLGQHAGGYQCLLALGFKELQQGEETEPRNVFVLEVCPLSPKNVESCADKLLPLVVFLQEPDLSEDLDAWSNWFDELKEMLSLVESKL